VKGRETYSETGSAKATVTIEFSEFKLQGLLNGTYKYVTGILGKGETAKPYEMLLDGALKISSLTGTFAGEYVGDGTISFAASKVVDLETLGFAP
jgi:hypothetical protein